MTLADVIVSLQSSHEEVPHPTLLQQSTLLNKYQPFLTM